MAKCINVLRSNNFINPLWLPFLCEKTGAVPLVQPGLIAGRQAGRRNAATFRDI